MIEEHVYAGITFPGRHEVKVIAQELERQKTARKDAVVRSDRMEVKIADGQLLLDVPFSKERHLIPLTNNAWNHLLGWMGLEKRSGYYKWLMQGTRHTPKRESAREKIDVKSHWESARTVFNDFLHTQAQHRLVRLMDTKEGETFCRAFLSDKYKIVSSSDFFEAIVDRLLDIKAEIWHARLSEDQFTIYAVAPGLSAQIDTERTFDPGDGWISRWYGEKGDAYNAALSAWNSETGSGGYGIAQAVLRRVCQNYCIYHDIVNKTHVGRRRGEEELLSEETIREENKVFFMKISDYVERTFSEETFQKIVDTINGATRDAVPPEKAEEVARAMQLTFQLPEDRMDRIKALFYQNGDYSRHGLANAVTQIAHSNDLDPDAGFQLERIGSSVMETPLLEVLATGEKILREKGDKAVGGLEEGDGDF